MISQGKYGKMLTVEDGFLICPRCGHKVKKITPSESAERVLVYCKARECKREFYITISEGRCFESRGQ